MIVDKDRSYYIGASDTDKVVGSWKSRSWRDWFLVKAGARKEAFENRYMKAGNAYEHRILRTLGLPELRLDEQVIQEALRLRVNYDGCTDGCIYECKTYRKEKGFQLTRKIWGQVQVQMFVKGIRRAFVVAYAMEAVDYEDMNRPVDPARIQLIPVEYDPVWISTVYLPRLRVLSQGLQQGVIPQEPVT